VGGLVRATFENVGGLLPVVIWSSLILAAASGSMSLRIAVILRKIEAVARKLTNGKGAAMIKLGLKKTIEAAFFAVTFHTIGLDTLSL
jgi:hypothetical protein